MATRKGGFGGGLNPFGTSSLGSLSQYDIGADLADLEVYKTEVAWGNGLATDAEYLAALTKSRDATDPETQRRATAQNKLDDAVYRIDRSKADAKGLDALVAFDTAAIAKMNPDNLRYRDVQSSLDAELAQRRSRDYGKLVVDYNAGKTSTQSLLAWVNQTLTGITTDNPDYQNWTNVKAELSDRIVSEKDQKIYQDYQQGRLKAPEFLAYITARRDGYAVGSPQYADWANKVEDATKQIADTAQSQKDSAFFNRYDEGKVSDASYLKYLRTRISGMKSDDPQLGEWQHRLNQAVFSLAEDKLRFDVSRGQAPVSKLVQFYQAYRRTLNPGSAEWRTITRSLDALGRGGGVGGAGSSTRRASGTAGSDTAVGAIGAGPALSVNGKAITPQYTLQNILGLFAIDPTGKKKNIAAAAKYLDLNKSSLHNALSAGDTVWLFYDPRTPNATVAELDPQGNPTGRRVRGSAYLPVMSEAYSNLLTVESSNFAGAAEVALANHDYGNFATDVRRSGEALDQARTNDAQYRQQNWETWYKQTSVAVDNATHAGDYTLAVQLSLELAKRLAAESQNPYLDDTRRAKIDALGEKLAASPLLPQVDALGNVISQGAVNLTDGTLNPGWHHVLKGTATGQPDYGPVFDDRQDGTWEANHVTVHTALGGAIVTGEVQTRTSPVNPQVIVHTPQGYSQIALPQGAQEISFPDEHGQVTRAYSLDGVTWISPGVGMPAPTVEINANLLSVPNPDGSGGVQLVDTATGKVVFTQQGSGWAPEGDYFAQNPDAIGWYGQAAWMRAKNAYVGGSSEAIGIAAAEQLKIDQTFEVGGPGQHMTMALTSADGMVNLVPPGWAPPKVDPLAYILKLPAPEVLLTPSRLTPLTAVERAGAMNEAAARLAAAASFSKTGLGSTYDLPANTPPRYTGTPLRGASATDYGPSGAALGVLPPLPALVTYQKPPSAPIPPLRTSSRPVPLTATQRAGEIAAAKAATAAAAKKAAAVAAAKAAAAATAAAHQALTGHAAGHGPME